jgi:iduronate 2-sulfatase
MTHYADLIDFPKPWDARVISRDQSEHLMHAYYACVSYVDAQIGRLLDALEQSPAFDNTIVVLWSDHGWKLGEFNGWGKMSNYEIDTRVPLIVAAPHLKTSGSTCDELVELVDLFPTLCDLAGIGIPDFVDGSSFVASLDDPTLKTLEPAFSQYYRKHDGAEYMGYAMRTDTHRFVEWREFATGEVTDRELYDHRRDPLESKNLVQVAAEDLLEELTQKLLQSHPRRELNMTPSVHSSPSSGRWKSDIEFHNKLKSSVSIYPISTSGKRGTAKKLASGERVKIEARLGGVYVVESDDGTLHEIHSPAFPARKIVLK